MPSSTAPPPPAAPRLAEPAGYDYDVVVIGARAPAAMRRRSRAQCGKNLHHRGGAGFGGTCLNVGCIPTKALIQTADVYQ